MVIKFIHTNIISKDWKMLADFYIKVFGCKPLLPERNLKGKWIEQATGIKNAQIRGIHLLLPGYEKEGPTLEIFSYNEMIDERKQEINNQGLAHIAFRTEDVEGLLNKIKINGGSQYGSLVNHEIEGFGTITFVYATDPEGNIIELQRLKK